MKVEIVNLTEFLNNSDVGGLSCWREQTAWPGNRKGPSTKATVLH